MYGKRFWHFSGVTLVFVLTFMQWSCTGKKQGASSDNFALGWTKNETEHFEIFDPPDSPRIPYFQVFGERCETMYKQLVDHLDLKIPQKIRIYRFITNQDCETATGHPIGTVVGYRIYTRIGAPMGGVIALAALTSIDPEASSFEMIRHGVREAFDNQSKNIHHEAARLRAENRWQPLAELMTPNDIADREAYDFESASFVAYLIQRHGVEKFKMLWRSVLDLGPSLEKIYGGSLQQIEADWIAHLEREAKKT